MKISLNRENFNLALEKLKKEYKIYAPIEIPFRGTFSDTSVIRYSEIEKIDEICFDKKSHFSAKEITLNGYFYNLLFVTLGNIIGGAFVGFACYYLAKKDK